MALTATRWDSLEGSLIGAAYNRAIQLAAEGREIFDLTSGEPDFPTPDNALDAARCAINQGLTKYTPTDGTTALKKAVQLKYRRDNGLEFGLDEICIGAGAKPLLYFVLLALLDAGDEVVIPAPAWASFPGMVEIAGGRPVLVPCTAEQGYKMTPAQLESAIGERTKAIILNTPTNPTGAVYSPAELREAGAVLERHPGVVIIADEIYEHLVYGVEFTAFAAANPALRSRTISINGASKAYAMTGWRIGFAAGPAAIMSVLRRVLSHSSGNPTSISQAAAVEALTGSQDLLDERAGAYQARRDRMLRVLNQAPGLSTRVPDGAFYLYIDCSKTFGSVTPDGDTLHNSVDFCRYLLESEGVATVPSEGFYAQGAFRISYACAEPTLEEAGKRIVRACNALRD